MAASGKIENRARNTTQFVEWALAEKTLKYYPDVASAMPTLLVAEVGTRHCHACILLAALSEKLSPALLHQLSIR